MSEDHAVAAKAAARAGVEVVELCELDQVERAAHLLSTVWKDPAGAPAVPADVLRALQVSGNYLVGAVAPAGHLVGVSVAWATPAGGLHSHVTAVVSERAGAGIGSALKLHQRAWAIERGLRTVSWTFDPLVRRNAVFNLSRLGAVVTGYAVDFYGVLPDELSGGDATDRLSVSWRLLSRRVARAVAGERLVVEGRFPSGLDHGRDGRPVRSPSHEAAELFTVSVPPDIEALRRTDGALASCWRGAVREVLGSHLRAGGQVLGLDRAHRYVCAPKEGA